MSVEELADLIESVEKRARAGSRESQLRDQAARMQAKHGNRPMLSVHMAENAAETARRIHRSIRGAA